jgi:hypothetical protein
MASDVRHQQSVTLGSEDLQGVSEVQRFTAKVAWWVDEHDSSAL